MLADGVVDDLAEILVGPIAPANPTNENDGVTIRGWRDRRSPA